MGGDNPLALYGLAIERDERKRDVIENRNSTVNTLYAVSKKQAYERLPALTNLPLPPRPVFWPP